MEDLKLAWLAAAARGLADQLSERRTLQVLEPVGSSIDAALDALDGACTALGLAYRTAVAA